jgi:hypothetical protein
MLVITNGNGTLTKDGLLFIVESLESTSAACSDHYKPLSYMMKNSATGNSYDTNLSLNFGLSPIGC